ncbi:MAG: B-box zinc finger protein [Candidatus Thorarchaeota archaeon]
MSELHLQICRFCQRNIKLAYYCEDCGASCCSDCLTEERIESFICQDCNSKNIQVSESGKKKFCKDCGNDNITQVNQLIKSCPKCHSNHIINIYEKKEELEKKFLELIKKARYFIEPFREIVNKLYVLRQKVKRARSPPINCYHYPNMESDLLSLFKLFIYAKENLQEKISILFHHLSLNKEYFFDIYTQPNSNVRIIEGILENLNASYDSINDFTSNNITTINKSMENLQQNLNFIDKIAFFFRSYKKFLNLAEEEKAVFAIYAKLANGLNTHEKYKKRRGILFITNFDLSFVHETGRIKKKKETIFKAPVQDLTKIKIKGKISKKLYIEFAYGRYEFTLPHKTITKVMDYILLARSFDELVIFDEEAAKRLYAIDIDLSDLINYIEEAINSFFSLKCQYNNLSQNKNVANSFNKQLLYQSQFPNIPNQQLNPNYSNTPLTSVYNQNNSPENLSLYPNNNFPDLKNNMIQTPREMRYYGNSLGQYLPPNYNENSFFLQNFYNPNRIQNYKPNRFTDPYVGNISDIEEKNILMRKLEQMQKYGPIYQNDVNKNNIDLMSDLSKYRTSDHFLNNDPYNQVSSYQEYSRNHLSDLFNDDYSLSAKPAFTNMRSSRYDKMKRKKILELEKERYSLEETLKTLDSKFEKGIISEIDYFRTYKNLQKDLYLVEKKIENLDEEFKEIESMRRINGEFDRKRYFT